MGSVTYEDKKAADDRGGVRAGGLTGVVYNTMDVRSW